MEKIDIKKPARIGVTNINETEVKAILQETEKVKLRIGVFFDGTGNNRFNSDSVYYNKKYSTLPLEEDKIAKIKNLKSFVIESGSSYWNSYSNIALLHDLYEEKLTRNNKQNVEYQALQLKFYIEGIGTLQDKEDDMLGSGMGEGNRGVILRVQQACEQIADRIEIVLKDIQDKNTKKPLEIISIQFDVFGFSRGAAAARHFSNEVLKSGIDKSQQKKVTTPVNIKRPVIQKNESTKDTHPTIKQYKAEGTKKLADNTKVVRQINAPVRNVFTGGALGKLLQKKNIKYPKYYVSIEFLGIFDTVISQMLEKKGIIDGARNPIVQALLAPFSPVLPIAAKEIALIQKVNPDLSNPNIKKILHLKAQTEWRDNFPVTPIGEFNGIFAREISVLGAHSDVGGAYWQTKAEMNTLHFFDLGVDADPTEKQRIEQQKELLRNWYISQKLCKNNQYEIKWEVFHHVLSFEGYIGEHPSTQKKELLEESFMGNDTKKIVGNRTYVLQGYHHKLLSTRPLNNKLSLVYMNVMKYIASQYANVPFLEPNSISLVPPPPHPKEYQLPEGDKKENDLENYQKLLIKVAEHGWTDKNGKIITYPDLIDKNNLYTISSGMYEYIMGNFVHLSANFNTPLADMLDHYNLAYANVPHFTDEKEFKTPPYQRESYTPILDRYDIS
ncbi:uncharacterized protein CHSO_0338 [Chryseobacterium sp. StRB126]|uniref:phospholipase effector Tle1 domain-containing protein n=1 Tax=Chryseobacterium sp. StRB126 TaxID=878220 RepID=UPI0004E99389|nr:DUF2235 domain-containing protein [Chryseobacterium sp. StRB126]BAP29375.1 uncharacterized protein CHSO_0338 [Chryseobacterium sp. StRB126]